MPSTKLKPLEVASSIEELNSKTIIPSDFKLNNIRSKCKSATKTFDRAEEYRKENDEEKAYILYMRYAEIIHHITRMKDYKTNKKFYDELLGLHNYKIAIERAEKLSESLDRRYKLMQEEAECRKKLELLDSIRNNSEEILESSATHDENTKDEKRLQNIDDKPSLEKSIDPEGLYNLLNSDSSCLIIDARSSDDYEKSHIKHDSCINIPEDIITPGITSLALEKKLPEAAHHLWSNRQDKSYVVLLDWNSTYDDVVYKTTLFSLKESITKWDVKVKLKNEPLILDGGYENLLIHYPMLTTNPTISIPQDHNKCDIDEITLDFEYPDLDEGFHTSPNASFSNTYKQTEETFPRIDRSTKPKSERKFSLTDSERKNSLGTIEKMVTSFRDNEEHKLNGLDNVYHKPDINRTLKPKALDTRSEKDDLDVSKIGEILSSVDENLKIEKEVNSQEQSLNELRLRREKEAEEAMRLEMQNREEQLLEQIAKLEIEKKKKEEEKKLLLQENEAIKRKYESVRDSYFKEKFEKNQEIILMKEKQKKQLEKETEKLRQERKEKERVTQAKEMKMKESEEKNKLYAFEKTVVGENNDSLPSDIKVIKLKDETDSKNQSLSSSRRSSLSRSHSSPNIAQMMAVEDAGKNIVMRLPTIDRQIKPRITNECKMPMISQLQPEEYSTARMRNLNPLYGNQGRALTGLRNLGNTCFMNSIIQCLAQTTLLASYFINETYRLYINRENPFGHHGEIAEEFAIVIKALWAGQYRSITPRDFKNTVSKFKPIFEGHEQQDSQEFLTFLMDGLHEDLNEVIRRPTNQPPLNTDNLPDEEAAKLAWEAHSKLNKSFIVSLFQGQYKSTVQCLHCKKISVTFDVFMYLSLPIPSTFRKCTLKECLQLYIKEERMSGESKWQCPRCKVPREATKNIIIWKLPHVLLIHLKRFSYEGMWRQKIQTFVDFPLQISFKKDSNLKEEAIFKDFVIGPKTSSFYSLYAVSNHYGTMEGGHYTAFCKNSENHHWYKFDDHEVTEMKVAEVNTAAAYILFYTSVKEL